MESSPGPYRPQRPGVEHQGEPNRLTSGPSRPDLSPEFPRTASFPVPAIGVSRYGMLELVGLCTDPKAAAEAAAVTGGILEVNHPGESDARPYSALVRADTDNVEALAAAADYGLYTCFTRVIKAEPDPLPPDRSVAAFAMIGHPDLTHRQSDDHWRDTHAPLALVSHLAMCDYKQLSVVANISGQPLDGIALCAFATREDLSQKFFNDDEAKAAIGEDVAKFADLRSSIRRVVLVRADGDAADGNPS